MNSSASGFVDRLKTDRQAQMWTLLGTMLLVLLYSYWNSLVGTAEAWSTPMYEHGWLIPAFAAFLIYLKYEPFGEVTPAERWVGAGLVVLATSTRIAASYLTILTAERFSLLPALMGIFILVGGYKTIRWAGLAIAFLVFMFPYPRYVVDNLLRPMQTFATMNSVYALQTFGVDAYRDGNRIELEPKTMNVAEQCSGLKMATTFAALCLGAALISNRPLWERIIVALSGIPIAMIANISRITLTGLLFSLGGKDIDDSFFHDAAGSIMLVFGFGLVVLEMQILSRLVIEDRSNPSTTTGMGLAGAR